MSDPHTSSTDVSHVSCSSPARACPSPLAAHVAAPTTAVIDATTPAAPPTMVRPFQLLSSDLQAARVQPAMPLGLRHPPWRFSVLASTGTCFSALSVCEPNLVTTVHDHDAKTFQCALCLDLSFSAFASLRRHRTTTHAGTDFADAYRLSCGCDESFTTRLLALCHSNACAPTAAPTPSPLRPFVPHAVRAAFPAVPALTAALAEVAADEECTNQNNTTLAVAPPLASRFAASGAGIPPQPCVPTLAVGHAVPTDSPARQLLSCPTCSRCFPSKRSPAQRACTSGGSIAAKHPRFGPPRVPPTLPLDIAIAPEIPVAAPAPVTFVLRTDGGCRVNGATAQASNPGGAGSALSAPDGTYQALLNGLQGVLHWRLPTLRIECDSQLVLSQVSGNARVSLPLLRSLRNRVLKALAHLRHKGTFTSLHHIPRNENTVANAAMDLKETSYECHCVHPAIACVPWCPALMCSALPRSVPALVSFANGVLVSRSDTNAP
ncbi:hypothetical protein H257_11987 [Aphanomyces astaci]|uniref:RNase H type-1 domain-containing protein n=1 Tax=Aphanomyces astaci TaxID=112090 RepID=W4G1M1_APHAT|nr:hypothetical protein H257_11987 [Aphanomyces astaci]ETV73171.1 hypothetical protein H257_11987 [Aphanomyces astaci]|eukprot:XP_009837376.1 hypothetical protein H257_11987 [Aphanomyces astaci]